MEYPQALERLSENAEWNVNLIEGVSRLCAVCLTFKGPPLSELIEHLGSS